MLHVIHLLLQCCFLQLAKIESTFILNWFSLWKCAFSARKLFISLGTFLAVSVLGLPNGLNSVHAWAHTRNAFTFCNCVKRLDPFPNN